MDEYKTLLALKMFKTNLGEEGREIRVGKEGVGNDYKKINEPSS